MYMYIYIYKLYIYKTSNQLDWHWGEQRTKNRGHWRSFIRTHRRQLASIRNWWWW